MRTARFHPSLTILKARHVRLMAPKVRAFVDWAAPRLQSELKRLSDFDL